MTSDEKSAFDLAVEFMKKNLPENLWSEFLIIVDKLDTESKRNLIAYQNKIKLKA